MSRSVKSDCLGCTKRVVGCHAKCQSYQVFLVENDKRKKVLEQERLTTTYITETLGRIRELSPPFERQTRIESRN